jgi:hypothetical protein
MINLLEMVAAEQIVTEAWNDAFEFRGSTVGEAVQKVGGSLMECDREVLGEQKQHIKKAKNDLEMCR